MASKPQQVRVLTLELNKDGSSIVYKLQKDWILQFRLGSSLLGQTVDLYTNYPLKNSFERNQYSKVEWSSDSNNKSDDTSIFANIFVKTSGSFHFYIKNTSGNQCGQGYFLVDPTLKIGTNETLPLDCIQCQTVLSKNLGSLSTWQDKFQVAKECGYNMLHFTPVHVIGASNSAYSLSDQHNLDPKYQGTWGQVHDLVVKMKEDWKMLSICDIVLNHTANESQWILDHPECSYNCSSSPHLRPAFLLDRMLFQITLDIAEGKLEPDIPKGVLDAPHHFDTLETLIFQKYLPPLKLHEFFMIDVDIEKWKIDNGEVPENDDQDLKIILDPERKRLGSSVNRSASLEELKKLNQDAYDKCQEDLKSAIANVLNGAKYERLDDKGPKIQICNADNPIICEYFTCTIEDHDLTDLEAKMYDDEFSKFFMVHNGWVMGMDPSVDFASPESKVYFRRELVAWGDSVKLNYGTCPQDNPFLWQYMKEYVEQVAKIFHGVRLDNCHSTPILVAEYLLDAARKINPDLYVIAELFTGSEETDNKYLNRLGINSLIREGLRAWNSHELGRLVYHYGGDVVGSFAQPHVQPLQPCRVAHAILFDQTHDNQSSMELRTVYDCLPSSALCLMASCAYGSNRGYDELVPHHIHVVKETREYQGFKGLKGIMEAKQVLNRLHFELGQEGFNEVFVDQLDPDVVAITRHDPQSHQSLVLVAHTVFNHGVDLGRANTGLGLNVEGQVLEIVIEANLNKITDEAFEKDDTFINGLDNFQVDLRKHIPIQESKFVRLTSTPQDPMTRIDLNNFKPGSIIAFKFKLHQGQLEACQGLQKLLQDNPGDLQDTVKALSLNDLNHVLFKCEQEEQDDINGGVYSLDGYGALKYAGLQGIMSILAEIRPRNDLGNWLPNNLRSGDWMLDYIINRLKAKPGTAQLGSWFESQAFSLLRKVPRFLIPRYFDSIISMVYCKLLDQVWSQMNEWVQNGSGFVKALALGSVQHGAVVKSALLPPTVGITDPMVSLAAGLPHFSTGYMRNWGRDTFISLRGFFILTGRDLEAKNIILAYAACLRHGLIPNLLDGGFKARFNCRDAVWWWLNCIKSFVQEIPNGVKILKEPVSRIFPQDDSEPHALGQCVQSLEDVIQEALQKHFQGLKFRERNAGKMIDEHMVDEGFNNEIGVDLKTGFVYGGNLHNCGTWMDKMGSSSQAGNKGQPATPRDGSAVELIGLSYSSISWLAQMSTQGHYAYKCVRRVNEDCSTTQWTLKEWACQIKTNFENFYYVDKTKNEPRSDLINKEFIYKDTLNSAQPWTDYQLRCNFPIAMAVAPELFEAEHAWKALQIAKEKLLGPLGMATLDPDDWMYRPFYDNSNQSGDRTIAHGYNYHQGPEWVWPVGYFLRAYLHFGQAVGKRSEAVGFCMSVLSGHYTHVQNSHWRGIPELTNQKGEKCPHSNPIQAWSMACLLEVLRDIQQI